MTLTYKTKVGDSKVSVIPMDPPLSGYDEVKPRLLGMKAEAQEGLGMVQIRSIPLTVSCPHNTLADQSTPNFHLRFTLQHYIHGPPDGSPLLLHILPQRPPFSAVCPRPCCIFGYWRRLYTKAHLGGRGCRARL